MTTNGRATIREVYALVNDRFDKLERKMDERFDQHQEQHKQETAERSQAVWRRLTWAVAFASVLVTAVNFTAQAILR